jgi:hypothetical protein
MAIFFELCKLETPKILNLVMMIVPALYWVASFNCTSELKSAIDTLLFAIFDCQKRVCKREYISMPSILECNAYHNIVVKSMHDKNMLSRFPFNVENEQVNFSQDDVVAAPNDAKSFYSTMHVLMRRFHQHMSLYSPYTLFSYMCLIQR